MRWLIATFVCLAACSPRPQVDTLAPEPVVDGVSLAPRPVGVRQVPPLSGTLDARLDPVGTTSVTEVRSGIFTATVVGAQGPKAAAVEWLAPSGELYQRLEETLFGGPFDPQTLDFDLPIGGTHIDQAGLAGTWTARLIVDGQILATRSFELAP